MFPKYFRVKHELRSREGKCLVCDVLSPAQALGVGGGGAPFTGLCALCPQEGSIITRMAFRNTSALPFTGQVLILSKFCVSSNSLYTHLV